jgi:hypothetical protein
MDEQNPYVAPQSALINEQPAGASEEQIRLRPFFWFLVQTVVLVVFSALLLDGGRFFRVCLVAVLVQCALVVLIVLRRGSNWTRIDSLAVKWGLIALVAAVSFAAVLMGRL